jgi:hypothetical protein
LHCTHICTANERHFVSTISKKTKEPVDDPSYIK